MEMQKRMTARGKLADCAAPLGLRERAKLEKRRRIKAAAREVFVKKGYDAATTREIAALAEVGIGTLFVYAKDKRELLMMIVNDDLDEINEASGHTFDRGAPLIDQVVAFFTTRYAYWASEPALARAAVQETSDFLGGSGDHGPEIERFYARRPKILARLTELIRAGQESGKVADDIAPELIASLFMTIYLSEVRSWLSQAQPVLDSGIGRLRELLALAMRGVLPAGGTARKPARKAARRP